jgi:hypothetical protein
VTACDFPPPLTPAQLGPACKPGVCAYAPRLGCGQQPARFYLRGWRCTRHARLDPAGINAAETKTGAER